MLFNILLMKLEHKAKTLTIMKCFEILISFRLVFQNRKNEREK